MPDNYFIFGEVIDSKLPDNFTLPAAKETWNALNQKREFTIIEGRRRKYGDRYAEILIVDCENEGIPTRNKVGIEYRERLGLLFHSQPDLIPEVRALRADFPATPHQNHVPKDEPACLCLYFEPWSAVRRTWTPQKHLNRILWWFAETASGTLHRSDQPLEQLYFQSPIELILPYDFEEKLPDKNYKLVVRERCRHKDSLRLVGAMFPQNANITNGSEFPCIALSLPSIVHGPIEYFPHTLGKLNDQLGNRGGSFSKPLFDAIIGLCQNGSFVKPESPDTLIIFSVPLVREISGLVEHNFVKGFIVHENIADIGIASGALHKVDNKYWAMNLIGIENKEEQGWQDFKIDPIEIVPAFTSQIGRKTCGIKDDGPVGTIAGVGSLGSAMFNLWTRSGWGQWTLVDPDHIKPHNLARHSVLECHVGVPKVEAIRNLGDLLIPWQPSMTRAVAENATNIESAEVKNALESADIVVDATTTLDFPRMLSTCESVKRALSVFVTPSVCGAAMLVEDVKRTIRLDALEAQYYKHIISELWGEEHLKGHQGHFWSGAGCRDISMVVPNELIAIHGANLARMVRTQTTVSDASMNIWHYDESNGSILANSYKPAIPRMAKINGLNIVWDEEIREKIHLQRKRYLPNETGGVLLGYFDLILNKVFIVDALAAPIDSREESTGFLRGIEGLEDAVKKAGERTANVVGYVGEWHSHPRRCSVNPSWADIILLVHLAKALEYEGLPALMLIVGDNEDNWLAASLE